MKIIKRILIAILILIVVLILISIISICILKSKSNNILDDYSSIYINKKYQDSILIDNVDVFKQDVSCGYAVIEMFAKWDNNLNLTEKTLY